MALITSKSKLPLRPLGSFYMEGEELIVMFKTPNNDNRGFFYVELPDNIFGFKSCKISYPDLVILNREGFNDKQMSRIIRICKKNMKYIPEIVKEFENA